MTLPPPVEIAALPDLAGAIRAYLRSLPPTATLVGDRVWIGWPKSPDGTLRVRVPPYFHAVLIETGRGGLPPDPYAPFQYERVDLSFLGPTEEQANALYRALGAYLYDARHQRCGSFRAANTLVSQITQEGGPIRTVDGPTGWPRTTCGYQFRYCAIPLSELV